MTKDMTKAKPEADAKLPPRPKAALVNNFYEVADMVGINKALRILTEKYGTETPWDLKVSQLMDAIDALYEAA